MIQKSFIKVYIIGYQKVKEAIFRASFYRRVEDIRGPYSTFNVDMVLRGKITLRDAGSETSWALTRGSTSGSSLHWRVMSMILVTRLGSRHCWTIWEWGQRTVVVCRRYWRNQITNEFSYLGSNAGEGVEGSDPVATGRLAAVTYGEEEAVAFFLETFYSLTPIKQTLGDKWWRCLTTAISNRSDYVGAEGQRLKLTRFFAGQIAKMRRKAHMIAFMR